jgi:hypothetical protein
MNLIALKRQEVTALIEPDLNVVFNSGRGT